MQNPLRSVNKQYAAISIGLIFSLCLFLNLQVSAQSKESKERKLYDHGWTYLDKKQYELAIKDFTAAIVVNRNYENAYFARADAYYHVKKYDLAIKDLTTVIRINPNAKDAYSSRGDIYKAVRQDYKLAIKDYRAALKIDPDYQGALDGLADAEGLINDEGETESEVVIAKKINATSLEIDSYTNSTNITVKKGNRISLKATGAIVLGVWAGSSGPGGIDGYESYSRVESLRHGALLVRIGSGKWSLVGASKTITATTTGKLEFIVNDADPSNNSGCYSVSFHIN